MADNDWAVRCNLVTIEDQTMRDFTAGHVSSEEAAALLAALQEKVGSPSLRFLPGVSYRNLLIAHAAAFTADTRTLPPHDLTDQNIADAYPRGPGSSLLVELMTASEEVFAEHPVNLARRKAGKPPVTNVWLWGQGSAPRLEPFEKVYGVRGAMITAVDLLRGLARLIGWHRIDVNGATGYLDTDYAAKGRAAIEALKALRSGMRPYRGPGRGLARGSRGRQDRGPPTDRPAYRRAAVCGPKRLSAMANAHLARPSHAAADEDAQPRRRADCDCRQRRRAGRVFQLRRPDCRAILRVTSRKDGK